MASSGHGPPVAHGGHPLPGMAVVPGGPVPLTPGPPSYGMAFEGQLDAVRSKMLPYLRYYSFALSPVPVPKYLRRVLDLEGCPFCLHTETVGAVPLVSLTCVEEGSHQGPCGRAWKSMHLPPAPHHHPHPHKHEIMPHM